MQLHRCLVVCACVIPLGDVAFRALAQEKPKVEQYRGKVVSLAEALKKQGIEIDVDARQHWLALETEAGQLHPLVKDQGSRMFFNDPRLLNRTMNLRGRLIGATGLLQVLHVQSVKESRLHDVYYWCDVCAIRRSSLEKSGICECCGGPMELREVPAEK
jgi:hypothetical protein